MNSERHQLSGVGVHMVMNSLKLDLKPESLPPSCLGPDGKFKLMSEEEHRQYIESALRRLDKIEQMTDDDPAGAFEEFMRGIDEGRPHRPLFKGYY